MPRIPASGVQFVLRAGDYRAEIASVGASLRSLAWRGRDLVVPYAADELRPAMRGALLAPWPNRLADGRYAFGGATHQLPVTEIATRTAAHGLVAWTGFDAERSTSDTLRLSSVIEPQPGYPWRVQVEVVFAISASGLEQVVRATNLSADPAPFGVGGHPYLLAGPQRRSAVDGWRLEVPADEVLLVSADRLLPTARIAVDGGERERFDFRAPRPIGDAVLNHAYTALHADADGRVRVRLTGDDGGTEIDWDAGMPWVQLYTADGLPGDDFRHALAVEPMTCPPDAFTSGDDLRTILPGESTTAAWTIRALG